MFFNVILYTMYLYKPGPAVEATRSPYDSGLDTSSNSLESLVDDGKSEGESDATPRPSEA